MNRPILTLFTGTPTALADAALPPTANTQLPVLVRFRIHVARSTNRIHHTTVIFTDTPPMVNVEANRPFADSKP